MTQSDRQLLALLAVGVGLVYVSSLHFGSEFGWPGLTTGTGKGGSAGPGAPKPPPKGSAPGSGSAGRTGGSGRPGDGVIDVANPTVVSLEEYKRLQAARARAARARKPKP